jgi:tetratricopeptide (TPR) repeat protein
MQDSHRYRFAAFLVFILVALVYSNTFQTSWHLDDYPNIVRNPRLHINDLRPTTLAQSVFIGAEDAKKLYRPVARLSLALNWYWGQDDVWGYHLINLVIHVATALLLLAVILELFKSPRLSGQDQETVYFVSVLACVLWALNPIQTQAVTYIVQRMAILATLFYVLGMYFYVKGRMHKMVLRRFWYYTATVICFSLAIGSKENAITMPLALLLIEFIFFQTAASRSQRQKFILVTISIGVVLLILGIIMLAQRGGLSAWSDTYRIRSFTMTERILTQPRVVMFYLGQLFYPMPQRLSIEHDVALSTSLLEPWTTLPAILTILALIGVGIWQVKARPILAFGLLFYLLNQAVESTFLPLEIMFEHRNYLPSLFLFWPVANVLKQGADYYHHRNTVIYCAIVGFCGLVIIVFGLGTYTRNSVWQTEATLWEDALKKAPNSARPLFNMAKYHYKKIGRYDLALMHYQKAYQANAANPSLSKAMALNGMGSVYYHWGQFEAVRNVGVQALAYNPYFEAAMYNVARANIKLGQWREADQFADRLLAKHAKPAYLNLKAFLLLKQNQPHKALEYLEQSLNMNSNNGVGMLYLGYAFSLKEQYQLAEESLLQARQVLGHSIQIDFCLLENSIKQGNEAQVRLYARQILSSFTLGVVIKELQRLVDDNATLTLSHDLIGLAIAKQIEQSARLAPMKTDTH